MKFISVLFRLFAPVFRPVQNSAEHIVGKMREQMFISPNNTAARLVYRLLFNTVTCFDRLSLPSSGWHAGSQKSEKC